MARIDVPRSSGTSQSRMWVPFSQFSAASLSGAVIGTLGNAANGERRTPAFLLDATSSENVVALLHMPEDWATFDVDLWWSNAGAGSGDVVWRCRSEFFSDAEDTNDATDPASHGDITVTAPAQYVIKVTAVAAGLTVATADDILKLYIQRRATDVADTLANDAGMLGVMLGKAS